MIATEVRNIGKSFGEIVAVDDVSFSLYEGEILGLLGPNGAGKTTTIRMLLDIFKPDHGEIEVLGGLMDEEKKDRIGYLPEERGLYQDISLEKCLHYLASLKGMESDTIQNRLNSYLERFDLMKNRRQKVKELSKGMQQKAQLIATFIHHPKIIIVDEPFSALDPVNTQMAKDLLREERARGTAIMMSTHQMNQAEALCDRILLIANGRLVLSGNLKEIRRCFSKNEILLRASSPIPERIAGVTYSRPENDQTRLFLKEGIKPGAILAQLIQSGVEVEHFETAQPTLDDIFIEVVTGKNKAA